jgi:hypothetical protein
MAEYLVGMKYHTPEGWDRYRLGIDVWNYESSTGIFINAPTSNAAIAWGEKIAEALFRRVNSDDTLDWKRFGYRCWIEKSPDTSHWKHCLSFFQRIKVGEWPDFEAMGSAAYIRWANENGIYSPNLSFERTR